MGDGVNYWTGLTYTNTGPVGQSGATGARGEGVSKVTTATFDFGNEDYYVETIVSDPTITSAATIMVQVTGEDYIVQDVMTGLDVINPGVGYTLWAKAPEGAIVHNDSKCFNYSIMNQYNFNI